MKNLFFAFKSEMLRFAQHDKPAVDFVLLDALSKIDSDIADDEAAGLTGVELRPSPPLTSRSAILSAQSVDFAECVIETILHGFYRPG